jgi:hypothetical protein
MLDNAVCHDVDRIVVHLLTCEIVCTCGEKKRIPNDEMRKLVAGEATEPDAAKGR